MRKFAPALLLALPLTLFAAGCASSGDADTKAKAKIEEQPVESLYNKAASAMDAKQYKEASSLFEEVVRLHPYSEWAIRAELMSAYADYQGQQYDEAIIGLDRFIELHPGNKDIDYAMYLKALCFYEQISDVARDQLMTQEALKNFDALIRRYPDSRYSRDATLKRDLTLDHLAGKEMEIGRYYLNRGEINAAINRFRTVIKDYQTTTHVPEALHRMVESYMTLGLKDQALRVAAVLGYNYPGSSWYEDTYKLMDPEQRKQLLDERGWVDRTVDTLLKPD
ncbi:MAG: outer membrane protein assembly factor BamD [Micavibrio aeruginosavorus]|nr:outer membrane protein assembly factor BamD [Micavibrio aeruginosavorus]